jgi:hypothetical protein
MSSRWKKFLHSFPQKNKKSNKQSDSKVTLEESKYNIARLHASFEKRLSDAVLEKIPVAFPFDVFE